MAWWLVRLSPDRAIQVFSWSGVSCCVLGQDTSILHCLSLHPGVYIYIGELNPGGLTVRWTSIPSRGK